MTDGGHNLQFNDNVNDDKSCGTTIPVTDPQLGPLAYNPGNTATIQTMGLTLRPTPSPAIDAGDNTICKADPVNNIDEQGTTRDQDGNNDGNKDCDIGAYELKPVTVSNLFDDPNRAVCLPTDCTLRAALDPATGADQVVFASGLSGRITLNNTLGPLMVTHNVVINGPGASTITVSGGNAVQVFQISSGVEATIRGITVADGFLQDSFEQRPYAVTNGAGIFNQGHLTLTDCIVANNRLSPNASNKNNTQEHGNGAGLANIFGAAYVSNCQFLNNVTTDNPFGNFEDVGTGGGIYNQGFISIERSMFQGNSAGGNGGGAVYNENGTATITTSTFDGNGTNTQGGGISNDQGTVDISRSTFMNNDATVFGGAIFNQGGFFSYLTILNSTFFKNAQTGTIFLCTFNCGGGGGGPHAPVKPTPTLNPNIGGGGAISSLGRVYIVNSTFSQNSTAGHGGAIQTVLFPGFPGGSASVKNTIIADSTSGGNCDAPVYDGGYNLDTENSCGFAPVVGFASTSSGGSTNPITQSIFSTSLRLNKVTESNGSFILNPPKTSIVINHIPVDKCVDFSNQPITTDERGFTRPFGSGCDIGAVESGSSAQIGTATPGPSPTPTLTPTTRSNGNKSTPTPTPFIIAPQPVVTNTPSSVPTAVPTLTSGVLVPTNTPKSKR